MTIAPDRASYIVGYRQWDIWLPDDVWPPMLVSLNRWGHSEGFRWQHRKSLKANCVHASVGQRSSTWPILHNRVNREDEPEIPAEKCECGIYAWKSQEAWKERNETFHGHHYPVSGFVALWGRYIEHKHGWRAQYAYPLELWVDTEQVGPLLAWALQESYRVPVHLKHRPKWQEGDEVLVVPASAAGIGVFSPGSVIHNVHANHFQFIGNQMAITPLQPPRLDAFEAPSPTTANMAWHCDEPAVISYELEISETRPAGIPLAPHRVVGGPGSYTYTVCGLREGVQYAGRVLAMTKNPSTRLASAYRSVTTPLDLAAPSAAACESVEFIPPPTPWSLLSKPLDRFMDWLAGI